MYVQEEPFQVDGCLNNQPLPSCFPICVSEENVGGTETKIN